MTVWRLSRAGGNPEPSRTDAPETSQEPEWRDAGPVTSRSVPYRGGLEIFLVWTCIGLFLAAQRYLRGPTLQPRLALPWWESLAASLVTAYIWAALTPAVMRVARRFRPARGTALRNVPRLAAAAAAVALAHLIATNLFWQLMDPIEGTRGFVEMFLATLAFGGSARLATVIGIVGVTWGIDDYRTYRQKELRASELGRELLGTQLEALKLRLHPAFLFHTLESILSLIRTEPRAAARTVVQLGDILRLALHTDAVGLVPLQTELEYIRLYLQLEQTRLGERLEVGFAVEPEALEAAVPNLVLLPLVESAIANGVAARAGGGRVEVRARVEPGGLRLDVRETAADPSQAPGRIGLDDSFVCQTKMRLELLYPGRHSVALTEELGAGHTISLTLPLSPALGPGLIAEGRA